MPSYRLLRSNKESGPYSLNDLVALGLKPYDLIWVDGKSAAWRYPSEVTELKDFAPAVEEQPYDRFYKRSPEPEKPGEASPNEPLVLRQESIIPQKNLIRENLVQEEATQKTRVATVGDSVEVKKDEPVKKKTIPEIPSTSFPPYEPPKKKIFVSMPETNAFQSFDQYQHDNYNDDKYQPYLPKTRSSQQSQIPAEKKEVPVPERSYSPIDIHESDDTKLETKYTQSLDDIKEMYINTLVQRKTKNRRKEILRKYVKPALLPLFLVLSGIAIGFVINNKRSSPKAIQALSTVLPQQTVPQQKDDEKPVENKDEEKSANNKILQPDDKQNLVLGTETKTKKTIPPKTEVVIQSHKRNKTTVSVPKAVVPENRQRSFVPDDEVTTVPKKNVEVDPSTGERKKVVRDNDETDTRQHDVAATNDLPQPNKKNTSERSFIETSRRNIRDFVTVRSNDYLRGPFGGIRGLELTVYNKSGFLLDEVSVELQIMKPSEQPLRTDIITFRNISANGAVTVRVPDSQRGIRVDYRITNVASKQWEKSTAGL